VISKFDGELFSHHHLSTYPKGKQARWPEVGVRSPPKNCAAVVLSSSSGFRGVLFFLGLHGRRRDPVVVKNLKKKKKKTQIIKKNKENTDLSTTGIGVGKSQSGTKIVKKIVTIDTDFREINQVYMALNLYTLHF